MKYVILTLLLLGCTTTEKRSGELVITKGEGKTKHQSLLKAREEASNYCLREVIGSFQEYGYRCEWICPSLDSCFDTYNQKVVCEIKGRCR